MMKMRLALLSLLTILCVSLAALPATANTLFTTGGPQNNFVGTQPFLPFNGIGVSYDCPFHDCDVESISIWSHNSSGTIPNLGSLTWTLGPEPFVFSGPGITTGTANSFTNLGCHGSATSPVFQICDFSFGLGKSVDVPGGENWLTISGMSIGSGVQTYWEGCANTINCGSATLIKNFITGTVTGVPTGQAFTISGTPTVPEPSSMLMLGSGIIGLAAVLRRKLTR